MPYKDTDIYLNVKFYCGTFGKSLVQMTKIGARY